MKQQTTKETGPQEGHGVYEKLLQRCRGVEPVTAVVTYPLLTLAGVLVFLPCAAYSQQPPVQERAAQTYIYYFDGAGGGSTLLHWSHGLKKGLLESGYEGNGEIFPWNTGLGIVADQKASVKYKRHKAAKCARRIQQYTTDYRGAPVVLIGFSAGTVVTVFTLEELAEECSVQDVVLCGASISADYDLTRALKHVRHRMYVFTSGKDAVLRLLVPIAGTADRKPGDVPSAGLRGFRMPLHATDETRLQYSKIVQISWREEFKEEGDFGGHTDVLKERFVRHIAPIIRAAATRGDQVAPTGERG